MYIYVYAFYVYKKTVQKALIYLTPTRAWGYYISQIFVSVKYNISETQKSYMRRKLLYRLDNCFPGIYLLLRLTGSMLQHSIMIFIFPLIYFWDMPFKLIVIGTTKLIKLFILIKVPRLERSSNRYKSIIGLSFGFASAIFFTINGIIVQLTDIPPIQLVWWRCVGQFVILLPITSYRHYRVGVDTCFSKFWTPNTTRFSLLLGGWGGIFYTNFSQTKTFAFFTPIFRGPKLFLFFYTIW